MKSIYIAGNNGIDYVIVVDTDRPEGQNAIVYDSDLSDDELREVHEKFQDGTLDMFDAWGEWTTEEEAFGDTFWRKELDQYLRLEDEE